MRSMIACALLCVSLTACVGTGSNLPPDASLPSNGQAQQVVGQVIAATKTACAFVPTAQTVLGILQAVGGVGGSVLAAGDIAGEICTAVNKLGARHGGPRPSVHGVTVRGRFVR